ncbi:hypothetical protein ACW7G2_03700 [Luteimonas sp. A277]
MAAGSVHASTGCELRIRPETSGFFLSPTLDKVTVVEAKASGPDKPCLFMAGDELLRINDQVVPGRKAREVMKYWESLPTGAALDFSVRRNDEVISLVID